MDLNPFKFVDVSVLDLKCLCVRKIVDTFSKCGVDFSRRGGLTNYLVAFQKFRPYLSRQHLYKNFISFTMKMYLLQVSLKR